MCWFLCPLHALQMADGEAATLDSDEPAGRLELQALVLPSTRRVRVLLTTLLCFTSAAQGAAWALFTAVPTQAEQLFGLPACTQAAVVALTWTMNASNLGQAVMTPFSTWLVFGSGGLRKVAVASSILMIVQQALWVVAVALFHAPESGLADEVDEEGFVVGAPDNDTGSVSSLPSPSLAAAAEEDDGVMTPHADFAIALLCVGAASGGCGASFIQGCVSRFSAEWFEPEYRARVTAILYCHTYVRAGHR